MAQLLHLTIGPVQGFIDQARRTRDLWAGSFLLSCLAGVAMREVRRNGGRILYPSVDLEHDPDPLLTALESHRSLTRGPLVGSLPNRFKAEIPDSADPKDVADAVRTYWGNLAETVRRSVLSSCLTDGSESRTIWARQVGGFFEINWVAGSDPGDPRVDGAWLDRRKNWRNHRREPEGGDHCMLMPELQELSGKVRFHDLPAQDAFWDQVRQSVQAYVGGRDHTYDTLELRPTERLSAIALIKRLFPVLQPAHLETALGFVPATADDPLRPDGPSPIRRWASLSSLAAAPWMTEMQALDGAGAAAFQRTIRDAEGSAPVNSLAEQQSRIGRLQALGPFGKLDGKLFYDEALLAEIRSLDHVRSAPPDWIERERRVKGTARQALRQLSRKAQQAGLPAQPSPFYAVLRMDGDQIGAMLSDSDGPGPAAISQALAAYTDQVQTLVSNQQGVLIYAGGDDVLALFSVDTVLAACWALRQAYQACFRQVAETHATTSAGLAFAHMGVPFTAALQESKRLLETIAKDENGRDSLAVSITKQSGRKLLWTSTFTAEHERPSAFHQLASTFCAGADDDRGERFSSFVHRMRERYQPFFEDEAASADLIEPLFLAEWLKGQNTDQPGFDRAAEVTKLAALIDLCSTQRWPPSSLRRDPNARIPCPLTLDGALIVKFLRDNLILPKVAGA